MRVGKILVLKLEATPKFASHRLEPAQPMAWFISSPPFVCFCWKFVLIRDAFRDSEYRYLSNHLHQDRESPFASRFLM